MNQNGQFFGADAIGLSGEEYPDRIYDPFEIGKSLEIGQYSLTPLLQPVMEHGKRLSQPPALHEIAAYAAGRLALLPEEYKRFENPHTYKTGVSKKLMEMRNQLRNQHKTGKNESPDIGGYSK